MGVALERVQFKFASIVEELCNEPDVLSQFAVWLDLRLAEYKLKGAISLDCSGEEPDCSWMNGMRKCKRCGTDRQTDRHGSLSPRRPVSDDNAYSAVSPDKNVDDSGNQDIFQTDACTLCMYVSTVEQDYFDSLPENSSEENEMEIDIESLENDTETESKECDKSCQDVVTLNAIENNKIRECKDEAVKIKKQKELLPLHDSIANNNQSVIQNKTGMEKECNVFPSVLPSVLTSPLPDQRDPTIEMVSVGELQEDPVYVCRERDPTIEMVSVGELQEDPVYVSKEKDPTIEMVSVGELQEDPVYVSLEKYNKCLRKARGSASSFCKSLMSLLFTEKDMAFGEVLRDGQMGKTIVMKNGTIMRRCRLQPQKLEALRSACRKEYPNDKKVDNGTIHEKLRRVRFTYLKQNEVDPTIDMVSVGELQEDSVYISKEKDPTIDMVSVGDLQEDLVYVSKEKDPTIETVSVGELQEDPVYVSKEKDPTIETVSVGELQEDPVYVSKEKDPTIETVRVGELQEDPVYVSKEKDPTIETVSVGELQEDPVYVSKEKYNKCLRKARGSASSFCKSLMSLLFTEKDMAFAELLRDGQMGKSIVMKNGTTMRRRQLQPQKLEALRSACRKEYPNDKKVDERTIHEKLRRVRFTYLKQNGL